MKRLKDPAQLLDKTRYTGVYRRAQMGFGSPEGSEKEITGKIRQRRTAVEHRKRSEIVAELSKIEIESAQLEVRKEDLEKKCRRIKSWWINEIIGTSLEYDLELLMTKAAEIEKEVRDRFRKNARLDELDSLILNGDADQIIKNARSFGGTSVLMTAMARVSASREQIGEETAKRMIDRLAVEQQRLSSSKNRRHRSLIRMIGDRSDYQETARQITRVRKHIDIARRESEIADRMIDQEMVNIARDLDITTKAVLGTVTMSLFMHIRMTHSNTIKSMGAASAVGKIDAEISEIDRRLSGLATRKQRLLELAHQE